MNGEKLSKLDQIRKFLDTFDKMGKLFVTAFWLWIMLMTFGFYFVSFGFGILMMLSPVWLAVIIAVTVNVYELGEKWKEWKI